MHSQPLHSGVLAQSEALEGQLKAFDIAHMAGIRPRTTEELMMIRQLNDEIIKLQSQLRATQDRGILNNVLCSYVRYHRVCNVTDMGTSKSRKTCTIL